MLVIDGRTGEGGGQVLRTSLALSMITGIPVTLEHIRAKRTKPGLMRQHLTCVRAAKAVCGARVTGDEVRSSRLVFEPGEVVPGEYDFAIGTAGSTSLVLQTVLPALMLAAEPSVVRVSGGTHNQKAPPADYIERVFAPLLGRIGPQVEVEMVRAGFYPAGGGLLQAAITPCAREALGALELLERGADLGRRVRSVVSNLPKRILQVTVRARRSLRRSRRAVSSVRRRSTARTSSGSLRSSKNVVSCPTLFAAWSGTTSR